MTDRSRLQGPVYVLGAGFSRAISEHMPLTNELGDAVDARLHIARDEKTYVSFEERLTVLSTHMPFLSGHENTARQAQAQEVTAGIATEMDRRQRRVVGETPPLWLLQLVALWHAERATVITFNYDTLVEHAVGSLHPVIAESAGVSDESLLGIQIVYPAPTAPSARTIDEMQTADTRRSSS